MYTYAHKGPATCHRNYNEAIGLRECSGHKARMLLASIPKYCCLRSSRATACDLRVRTKPRKPKKSQKRTKPHELPKNPNSNTDL